MPNTNVLCAAALYLDGLGSVSQLIDFSNYIDCEIGCRELAGDKRTLARIRATIYHEVHKIVEDAKEEEIEQAQLVKDRRGIDRANDQQNYEEAYARGEI